MSMAHDLDLLLDEPPAGLDAGTAGVLVVVHGVVELRCMPC